MKIGLIVLSGNNSALAIAGVHTIFKLAQSHGFDLEFGLYQMADSKPGMIDIFETPHISYIEDTGDLDWLIIPSVVDDPREAIDANKRLIAYLISAHNKGAIISTLCTGAYILAETGLLDGLEASSNCAAISDLRSQYPNVRWHDNSVITHQNKLFTSGGTLSSFNILIYQLGMYFNRPKALAIAKFLQLEYPRESQAPFYVFTNQKGHGDPQILSIQAYFENHASAYEDLRVVAAKFNISLRTLNRKFKQCTGQSPNVYRQRVKVEQMKNKLEHSDATISELIYDLGYNDMNSFRNLFKRHTGMLPMEYRKKFK